MNPTATQSWLWMILCACVCVCFPEQAPFNTIGESGAVVGSRGVVAPYSIQEVVVRRHTDSASPLGHGSTHAPLVGVRIEALH